MSKGSARRPQQVTDEEMAANWDRIFGRVEPYRGNPVVVIESNPVKEGCHVVHVSPERYRSFTEMCVGDPCPDSKCPGGLRCNAGTTLVECDMCGMEWKENQDGN